MKKIIILFLVWFSVLFVVGFASRNLSTWNDKKCDVRGAQPYFRWDSSWYVSIEEKGYTFSTERNSSIAYFPLFPLVMKTFHQFIPLRIYRLGFLLNIGFSFLTLWIIYIFSKKYFTEKESFTIALVWLSFPASYFLLSGYPDALFAFLTAATFYFSSEKKWVKASLLASLLALTKPYGIIMAPILLLEYLQENGWKMKFLKVDKNLMSLFLPYIAFGAFVAFNFIKFKNPVAFLIAQRTWGRTFSNPFAALFLEAKENLFSGNIFSGNHFPYVIYLASFFFFILSVYLSWKYVKKTYLLFSILVMLTALLSGTLTSWGRYMFLSFPVFIGPAIYLSRKKYLLFTYILISSLTLIIIASYFVRCYPFE